MTKPLSNDLGPLCFCGQAVSLHMGGVYRVVSTTPLEPLRTWMTSSTPLFAPAMNLARTADGGTMIGGPFLVLTCEVRTPPDTRNPGVRIKKPARSLI